MANKHTSNKAAGDFFNIATDVLGHTADLKEVGAVDADSIELGMHNQKAKRLDD